MPSSFKIFAFEVLFGMHCALKIAAYKKTSKIICSHHWLLDTSIFVIRGIIKHTHF